MSQAAQVTTPPRPRRSLAELPADYRGEVSRVQSFIIGHCEQFNLPFAAEASNWALSGTPPDQCSIFSAYMEEPTFENVSSAVAAELASGAIVGNARLGDPGRRLHDTATQVFHQTKRFISGLELMLPASAFDDWRGWSGIIEFAHRVMDKDSL